MARRIWLHLLVSVSVCNLAGCIVPGYDGVKAARDAGPTCDTPLEARNRVYLFVLGGNNPREMMALEKFRQGINAAGYAKVAAGPNIYANWMGREIRRIHGEEPGAVFVVAGLESSVTQAANLCDKALAEGLPVEALAIVDSTGKMPPLRRRLRTLLIGTYPAEALDPSTQTLAVSGTSSYDLPAEPRAISAVVELINEIAIRQPAPINNEATSDRQYPFGREVPTSLEPRPDSQWGFMFDRPGTPVGTIEDALQLQLAAQPKANTTAAKP
jgi:hypothetical protein